MFATATEVGVRLGRTLSDANEATASQAIDEVSRLIAAALGIPTEEQADWIAGIDPPPPFFRSLCIDRAITAISNPQQLASQSKQLGAYQEGKTFQRGADGGLVLTKDEEKRVRRAYRGANFKSVKVGPNADDYWPE